MQVAFLFLNLVVIAAYGFSPQSLVRSPKYLSATNASSEDIVTLTVALTRELGKNDAIREAINNHPSKDMLKNSLYLNLVEIPCIQHASGPDLTMFQETVKKDPSLTQYQYILITSPESAKVFAENVDPTSSLPKIAAVGKATSKVLKKLGFSVNFIPSVANGESLAEELPPVSELGLNNILYPASFKAADTIQENLEKRKDAAFRVVRMNTYDTVPAEFSQEQLDVAMDDIDIACFGSPSAVDAWLANIDRALGIQDLDDDAKKKVAGCNGNVVAVCIGSTTAKRVLETGRWHASDIYYPSVDPGMDGWAASCFMACSDVMEKQFWGGGW
jgi:uroporphyrinogen-III synthase